MSEKDDNNNKNKPTNNDSILSDKYFEGLKFGENNNSEIKK